MGCGCKQRREARRLAREQQIAAKQAAQEQQPQTEKK